MSALHRRRPRLATYLRYPTPLGWFVLAALGLVVLGVVADGTIK